MTDPEPERNRSLMEDLNERVKEKIEADPEELARTIDLVVDIYTALPNLSAEIRKHYQAEVNAIAHDLERDLGVGELDAEGRAKMIHVLLVYEDDDDGDAEADHEPPPPRERVPVGVG